MRARVRRALVRFAIGAAAAVAATFAAKAFVGDVYLVHTPSMEPTIDGTRGEWVLVVYGGVEDLERFDLVVFREPGRDAPVVKRVLGLPGERVQVVGGDLLVDGRRLEPGPRWPVLVPVFDDRLLDVESFFHFGSAAAFERDADGWLLDALAVVPGSRAGSIGFHKDVGTGFLRANGERVPDVEQANDVVLTADVELLEGEGHAFLEVLEEGDRFQARLYRRSDGAVEVDLRRLPLEPGQRDEPWSSGVVEDVPPGAFECRLSNVDNRVEVRVDGRVACARAYDANRPYRGMTHAPGEPRPGTVRRSIGQRAVLGGVGVRARFARIRVARDLYYAVGDVFGANAVDAPLQLGPDEVFVLGDNTADSVDGRRFGPVAADEVVGCVRAVVWPPGRVRALP